MVFTAERGFKTIQVNIEQGCKFLSYIALARACLGIPDYQLVVLDIF
jgi:hypothetical protein